MTTILEVLEATEGGTRRHLADLVGHLDPARFRVAVACAARRDPAFRDDIRRMAARGVSVHVLPLGRAIAPLRDAVACVRLYRLLRRGGYDVVHTHSSKAGFVGRAAARLARVPRVVHTPHTFAFDMAVGPLARRGYRALERIAARWADRLVCVCPAQQAAAAALAAPDRVVVIPNGIAAPPVPDAGERARQRRALGIAEGSLVAGLIGRFTPQKGHADFVAAAARVAARRPDVRFLLVGDGALRPRVEALIRGAGLREAFVLSGAREDGPGLVAACDVVVLPSLWEGLPYVLLDAMAAGKGVVATRVGGMPDAVRDGESGLLVPPRDPAALADAMVKVLENDTLRAMMGCRARQTVLDRYRIDDMIRHLSALYEGAL